jgi:hypothetical protein
MKTLLLTVLLALVVGFQGGAHEFEKDGFVLTVNPNDELDLTITGYKGTQPVSDLVIPSSFEIDGKKRFVNRVAANAFKGIAIKNLDVSHISVIGNNAFDGCGLETLIVSSSLRRLGTDAFANNNFKAVSAIDCVDTGDYPLSYISETFGTSSFDNLFCSLFDLNTFMRGNFEGISYKMTNKFRMDYFNMTWEFFYKKHHVLIERGNDVGEVNFSYNSPELEGIFMPTGFGDVVCVPLDEIIVGTTDAKSEKGRKLIFKVEYPEDKDYTISFNGVECHPDENGLFEIEDYIPVRYDYDLEEDPRVFATEIFRGQNVLRVSNSNADVEERIADEAAEADTQFDLYTLTGTLVATGITEGQANDYPAGIYILRGARTSKKIAVR